MEVNPGPESGGIWALQQSFQNVERIRINWINPDSGNRSVLWRLFPSLKTLTMNQVSYDQLSGIVKTSTHSFRKIEVEATKTHFVNLRMELSDDEDTKKKTKATFSFHCSLASPYHNFKLCDERKETFAAASQLATRIIREVGTKDVHLVIFTTVDREILIQDNLSDYSLGVALAHGDERWGENVEASDRMNVIVNTKDEVHSVLQEGFNMTLKLNAKIQLRLVAMD